jgi:hypothetical protein
MILGVDLAPLGEKLFPTTAVEFKIPRQPTAGFLDIGPGLVQGQGQTVQLPTKGPLA